MFLILALVPSGVNFTVRNGDRVGIIGPNGSGKTTLLRILVGEQKPSRGEVVIGENVVFGYNSQTREQLDPDKMVYQEICGDQVRTPTPQARTRTHTPLLHP